MPILILSFSTAGNAALYYIAFAFGSLVMVIPDAIGISFFVNGSQGAPVKKGIIRAFTVTLLILIPAIIIVWFFGENILQWLGKDYAGAVSLLRIFVVSTFFTSVYQLFLYLEGVRMEPEVGFIFNVIRALIIIPLSYEFLIIFGIIGVAWAWLLGHIIICIFIVWYMRTHILREINRPTVVMS